MTRWIFKLTGLTEPMIPTDSEPRPIILQFLNWSVVEEVCQKVIHLNLRYQLQVIVNQGIYRAQEQYTDKKKRIPKIASSSANKIR